MEGRRAGSTGARLIPHHSGQVIAVETVGSMPQLPTTLAGSSCLKSETQPHMEFNFCKEVVVPQQSDLL